MKCPASPTQVPSLWPPLTKTHHQLHNSSENPPATLCSTWPQRFVCMAKASFFPEISWSHSTSVYFDSCGFFILRGLGAASSRGHWVFPAAVWQEGGLHAKTESPAPPVPLPGAHSLWDLRWHVLQRFVRASCWGPVQCMYVEFQMNMLAMHQLVCNKIIICDMFAAFVSLSAQLLRCFPVHSRTPSRCKTGPRLHSGWPHSHWRNWMASSPGQESRKTGPESSHQFSC